MSIPAETIQEAVRQLQLADELTLGLRCTDSPERLASARAAIRKSITLLSAPKANAGEALTRVEP